MYFSLKSLTPTYPSLERTREANCLLLFSGSLHCTEKVPVNPTLSEITIEGNRLRLLLSINFLVYTLTMDGSRLKNYTHPVISKILLIK